MSMSDNLSTSAAPLARTFDAPIQSKQSFLVRTIALMSIWSSRAAGRRTIRELTSEQVRALDLDPVVLREEGAKPFWRA